MQTKYVVVDNLEGIIYISLAVSITTPFLIDFIAQYYVRVYHSCGKLAKLGVVSNSDLLKTKKFSTRSKSPFGARYQEIKKQYR